MIRAVSRAWASLMVVAKLFQLFHPIGGVGARMPWDGVLPVEAAWAGKTDAVTPATPVPIMARRVSMDVSKDCFGDLAGHASCMPVAAAAF